MARRLGLGFAPRRTRAAQEPGFAIVAILTLGLGVGLNTAIFIFTDALIFRPPNVPRPSELVRIFSSTKDVPFGKVSYPDYVDFRSRTTALSGTVAYTSRSLPVSRNRDEVRQLVGALVVSGNYFSVLGVTPTPGRGYVYVPIATVTDVVSNVPAGLRDDRSVGWLSVVGRLKPAAAVATATAEMTTLARSLEEAYPATNRQRSAIVLQEMAARAALNPTAALREE